MRYAVLFGLLLVANRLDAQIYSIEKGGNKAISIEEVVPNRLYFHQSFVSKQNIYSVSFSKQRKLPGESYLWKSYVSEYRQVNKGDPEDLETLREANSTAEISWFPVRAGTVLASSFFGIEDEESFLRLEEEQAGDGSWNVKWKKVDQEPLPKKSTLITALGFSGYVGWSISQDGVWEILDRVAKDPLSGFWAPTGRSPQPGKVFERYIPAAGFFGYFYQKNDKAVRLKSGSSLAAEDFFFEDAEVSEGLKGKFLSLTLSQDKKHVEWTLASSGLREAALLDADAVTRTRRDSSSNTPPLPWEVQFIPSQPTQSQGWIIQFGYDRHGSIFPIWVQ